MLAANRIPDMNTLQFETRLARLEAGVEHTGSDILEIKGQLHDLRTSMDGKFEVVNQKFEAVNERFDAINDRFEAINDKFSGTDEKFGRALQRLEDRTNQRFEDVNKKFDALLISLGNNHAQLIEKMGEIKVWSLTVLGGGLGFGILGVLARALHWI